MSFSKEFCAKSPLKKNGIGTIHPKMKGKGKVIVPGKTRKEKGEYIKKATEEYNKKFQYPTGHGYWDQWIT